MERLKGNWKDIKVIYTETFTCGYCGREVASNVGIVSQYQYQPSTSRPAETRTAAGLLICPRCNYPTVFYGGSQFPDELPGKPIENLPEGVSELYDEARKSVSATAYTAAVLCCRKLLMHIGVERGAATDLKFVQYVNHLYDNHHIPPDAHGWVSYIKQKGNEANHQIVISSKGEAKGLLFLVEMLLKIIYELPKKVPFLPEAEKEKESKGVPVVGQHGSNR